MASSSSHAAKGLSILTCVSRVKCFCSSQGVTFHALEGLIALQRDRLAAGKADHSLNPCRAQPSVCRRSRSRVTVRDEQILLPPGRSSRTTFLRRLIVECPLEVIVQIHAPSQDAVSMVQVVIIRTRQRRRSKVGKTSVVPAHLGRLRCIIRLWEALRAAID